MPNAPDVVIDNIPGELKDLPRWVGWRYEQRKSKNGDIKWAKPPINVRNGRKANLIDPTHVTTFDQAVTKYNKQAYDGIGFVFVAGDPFSGVDLDDCMNTKTGILLPWAHDIIYALGSYTEISPSGSGVKIFVRGKLPPKSGRRNDKIEIYSDGRYFTVTGAMLGDTPKTIENRQEELVSLYERFFKPQKRTKPRLTLNPAPSQPKPEDISIITQAMTAKNGEKFVKLWSGDITDYESQSEADLALCGILAYWLKNNPEDIERVFTQSVLGQRDKWIKKKEYRENTISMAIQGKTNSLPMLNKLKEVNRSIEKKKKTQFVVGFGIKYLNTVSSDTSILDLEKKSILIVEDLVNTHGNSPNWYVAFLFVRKLRNLSQDHPKQFEKAIRLFCELTNREFEQLWIDYLSCWPKVILAEGEDILSWAAKMAEDYPFPMVQNHVGERYQKLASIAWHLSYVNKNKHFCLPRERLAQILGLKYAVYITRIIEILEMEGIITCVDPTFRFGNKKGKAKGYLFIGEKGNLGKTDNE